MPGRPFKPSLLFVGKAGAAERRFTRVGSSLTSIHKTRLEKPVRDEHSSLLQAIVNDGRIKFYNVGNRCPFHNTSVSLSLTNGPNKLECLSLQAFRA